jgi:uncharacterized protein (UPF0332 family)
LTTENKKTNIGEELGRAGESLESAEILFAHGKIADAVSRLYYYVYHTVRALLLAEGLEPKSHEGALRLLGMHFVKTGIVDPQVSHVFAKLMKYREEADYNPSYVFTKEDYAEFKTEAVSLRKIVEAHLRQGGLMSQ